MWLLAGSAGGIAFTAATFRIDEPCFGPSGLGRFWGAVVAYPALVAVLYGVPTGVVLGMGWDAGRRPGPRSG